MSDSPLKKMFNGQMQVFPFGQIFAENMELKFVNINRTDVENDKKSSIKFEDKIGFVYK